MRQKRGEEETCGSENHKEALRKKTDIRFTGKGRDRTQGGRNGISRGDQGRARSRHMAGRKSQGDTSTTIPVRMTKISGRGAKRKKPKDGPIEGELLTGKKRRNPPRGGRELEKNSLFVELVAHLVMSTTARKIRTARTWRGKHKITKLKPKDGCSWEFGGKRGASPYIGALPVRRATITYQLMHLQK